MIDLSQKFKHVNVNHSAGISLDKLLKTVILVSHFLHSYIFEFPKFDFVLD